MLETALSTSEVRTATGVRLNPATKLLIVLALAKITLHLVTNALGGYGYFRDELYYIACSKHLAMGYVDQPPLSIWILAASRALIGDSLFALRLLPAMSGAAVVYLTGFMARELGGRRMAQLLASLASLVSLIFLGMDAIYSMNCFDILAGALIGYEVIKLVNTNQPRWWIVLGITLGLGLLNKIGVLWIGFGLFVGILLTPHRRWLKTPWPWIAGTIALVLFSPFIIWNMTHEWAHLEFIHNATADKYSTLTPAVFAVGQVLLQNPVTLPVWLAGLGFFALSNRGRTWRPLAWIYVTAFAILLINGHSKPEYLSSAYAMLFAGGGLAIESWLATLGRRRLAVGYACFMGTGLVLAPAVLPILPVESYIRYAEALGIKPTTPEHKELAELPQFYADMFGWKEKAAAVAQVYNALSPEDRKKCAIFADNYGRCGAIDFFGPSYGLPPSVGRHNNYWIWGPDPYTGELVIILGGALEDKQEQFEKVEVAGVVSCPYCMPYENNLRIYVCRGLKTPLAELWPRLKNFD